VCSFWQPEGIAESELRSRACFAMRGFDGAESDKFIVNVHGIGFVGANVWYYRLDPLGDQAVHSLDALDIQCTKSRRSATVR